MPKKQHDVPPSDKELTPAVLQKKDGFAQSASPSRSKKWCRVIAPYILPAVTTLLVVMTLVFSLTGDRLYAAAIDGQIVGYVTEESVMDNAITQLENTMSEILNESYTFKYEVSYISARATDDKLILTEDTVFEALVPYAADQVTLSYSLFVNDECVATAATKDILLTAIKNVTAAIKADTPRCDSVSVMDEIKISAGLSSPDALLGSEAIEALLRGTDGKSPLSFRVEQISTYTEVLPRSVRYTVDPDRYIGDDVVIWEGKDGKRSVSAKVITVNGVETERIILEATVTEPAEDKEILQGGRVLPEVLYASGQLDNNAYMIYPSYDPIITSGFGYRYLAVSSSTFHRGLDIAAIGNYRGEYSIKSTVDGIVIEAGLREGDAEQTIVIEAEDGTKTCFDKMKTVNVKVGDKVNTNTTLGKRQRPILAAASGKVIFAEYNSAYGNQILIDHGNGLVTCYAHLSEIGVTVGQTVTQGQEIGKMGCTGVVTGLHVHFEVRIDGDQVDPEPFIFEKKPGRK